MLTEVVQATLEPDRNWDTLNCLLPLLQVSPPISRKPAFARELRKAAVTLPGLSLLVIVTEQ
ncbi:hypothetical protein RA20_16410 [Leisingera sp. ANG-Vp]|nr:hypothetical protein RA20_16410 [Leisingera sp. ANG-Vp]